MPRVELRLDLAGLRADLVDRPFEVALLRLELVDDGLALGYRLAGSKQLLGLAEVRFDLSEAREVFVECEVYFLQGVAVQRQ